MSIYSVQKMYCTVCGGQYAWTVNHGYPKSRTCCKECNEEFNWRETLSIMGKEYYPMSSKVEKEH